MVYKSTTIFVVSQTEDPISYNLLEAFVEITHDVTCNASYSGVSLSQITLLDGTGMLTVNAVFFCYGKGICTCKYERSYRFHKI